MTESYKRFLRMHSKALDGAPGAKRALERLFEENEHIKQKYDENKKIKRMLAHELKNPLNAIINFPVILKETESDEDKKYILDLISKSAELMNNLIGILYLDGSSREELKKKAEPLFLEGIARKHAFINNKEMEDEKIKLHVKYDQLSYHTPIEIYINKAIINAIWGTLSSNSFAWAPKLSTITQAFRINKANNLEIIMENAYAEKRLRTNKGMGEGIGLPFVKNIVNVMCGNFQTYKTNSQIKKDYDMDELWGYKKARNPEENIKIYGAKIIIPMEELTNSKKQIEDQ